MPMVARGRAPTAPTRRSLCGAATADPWDAARVAGRTVDRIRTGAQGLAFVERHGVVLAAARGPVPRLTEAVAGVPIAGSWWGHPEGPRIYAVLNEVVASSDVLVCRVVDGKVTLVHRRLWPSLVRVAERFEPAALAQVEQVHTERGHHERLEVPFPRWVPRDVVREARDLDEHAALEALGAWATSPTWPRPRRSTSRARRSGGRGTPAV